MTSDVPVTRMELAVVRPEPATAMGAMRSNVGGERQLGRFVWALDYVDQALAEPTTRYIDVERVQVTGPSCLARACKQENLL